MGGETWKTLLFVKESLECANRERAPEAEVWVQAARRAQGQSRVCADAHQIATWVGEHRGTQPKTSAAWMAARLVNSQIHSFTRPLDQHHLVNTPVCTTMRITLPFWSICSRDTQVMSKVWPEAEMEDSRLLTLPDIHPPLCSVS